MTTQTELDQDLLEVLERHLESRRELLKRVRSELAGLTYVNKSWTRGEVQVLDWDDVFKLMNRLIAEAKLP